MPREHEPVREPSPLPKGCLIALAVALVLFLLAIVALSLMFAAVYPEGW